MLKCYSYDIVCQEIPDEISLAVNISCCPNRCPGCHSQWLWEDKGEPMTEEMLSALIGSYSSAVTCFCFMGGDADPAEIQKMAIFIRQKFPGLKTAWYSGREELPEGFDPKVMDYIKLGPYKEALGGLKFPTTNQALYRIEKDGSFTKLTIS
ncbi:MAG: anaerobic ribonucleoside-triphosphate reductase activating protein [Bacteroidales bacterium]|nr:anaerobic ribonucleoside-triphosphate reductase activating protein [Bacteroidales bacterium]